MTILYSLIGVFKFLHSTKDYKSQNSMLLRPQCLLVDKHAYIQDDLKEMSINVQNLKKHQFYHFVKYLRKIKK